MFQDATAKIGIGLSGTSHWASRFRCQVSSSESVFEVLGQGFEVSGLVLEVLLLGFELPWPSFVVLEPGFEVSWLWFEVFARGSTKSEEIPENLQEMLRNATEILRDSGIPKPIL